MKFIVYLLTLFMVGTAVAQNPTILQGNYITNVFGQSNFVLNPNARTDVLNVTNATRSTTTPLIATSEFTLALTSGTNATWTLRAFDQGMKGQNCEARFSYRGFATATTKAELVQNSLVVASLTLTPATDPRIASINFPCGDLTNLTTFRIAQTTANMTGTNEIGGIYVGLATNQANVAQAEAVGGYKVTAQGTRPSTTSATFANLSSGTGTYVLFGKATSSDAASGSVTFSNLPAGNYMAVYTNHVNSAASTACQFEWYEDTSGISSGYQYTANDTSWSFVSGYFELSSAGSRTFRIRGKRSSGTNSCTIDNAVNAQITVYRFPTSSELVVTPERQNVYGGAQWTGTKLFSRSNTTEITISDTVYATNRTLFGKAQFTSTANDVAITIPAMPPGTYKVQLAGKRFTAQKNAVGTTDFGCVFTLKDGTNSLPMQVSQYGVQYSLNSFPSVTGVFTYSSVGDRTFTAYLNAQDANAVDCSVDSPKIIVQPLDQPSNSALYVQGPILGSQTGAAIPAGYVGEVTRSTKSSTNLTTGTYVNITSITLPSPGVYLLSANGVFKKNGATYTAAEYFFPVISNVNNGDNVAFPFQNQGQYFRDGLSTAFSEIGVTTNQIYVRYDGTNITWPSGSTTSSGVLYLNAFSTIFTSGTPLFTNGLLQAIRLN